MFWVFLDWFFGYFCLGINNELMLTSLNIQGGWKLVEVFKQIAHFLPHNFSFCLTYITRMSLLRKISVLCKLL